MQRLKVAMPAFLIGVLLSAGLFIVGLRMPKSPLLVAILQPTDTPTPTSTFTPTQTPTNTPTSTFTPTFTPTITPTSTLTFTPTETPTPFLGKWKTAKDVASLTNDKRFILTLDAEKEVYDSKIVRLPILYLRCWNQKTDVYVFIQDMELYHVSGQQNVTIRYRLDNQDIQSVKGWIPNEPGGVFFLEGQKLIGDLEKTNTMAFGFTPAASPEVETSFDLRGLSAAIDALGQDCGWNTKG
jgi:hypothetical protein